MSAIPRTDAPLAATVLENGRLEPSMRSIGPLGSGTRNQISNSRKIATGTPTLTASAGSILYLPWRS